jgi:hypothetical protein
VSADAEAASEKVTATGPPAVTITCDSREP